MTALKNDPLNEDAIRAYCTDLSYPLYVFDTIDSTNNYAKHIAASADAHGTLIVAAHQTAGRGRRGHTFYSPANCGLYLSLIIKPHAKVQDMLKVTVAAAVAAVEAIEETSDAHPKIKWVNDLFIGRRKIAGILTEAVSHPDPDEPDAIVIGIGINVRSTDLPEDIENIAGAIDDPNLKRSHLAAVLWQRLLYWTEHLDDPNLMEQYRSHSFLLGHEIIYEFNNHQYSGTVTAINDEGNLVIQNRDNEEIVLSSGEVSVKDW